MIAPRPFPRVLVAVVASCGVLCVGLSTSASGSDRREHRSVAGFSWPLVFSGPVAATWPGLPPPSAFEGPHAPLVSPATLQRFWSLWAAYHFSGARLEVTFGDWLLLNGITDPREWCCMMWLYWHHVNRLAAG